MCQDIQPLVEDCMNKTFHDERDQGLEEHVTSSRPTWYIRARKLSYVSQVLFQIKIRRINNLHGQFVRWVSRLAHTAHRKFFRYPQ